MKTGKSLSELEATGYRIITIAPALWNSIASAARKEMV